MEVAVRRHRVQCQLEGDKECVMSKIQEEINCVYVKTVENELRKLKLSKEEMIVIIDQIQDIFKNL